MTSCRGTLAARRPDDREQPHVERAPPAVLRQNRVRPARANVRAVLTARKKLRIRREAKVVGILWPST